MVLLIALIVIGGLVWLFVARPWSASGGEASSTPTPSASADPTASSDPDDADGADDAEAADETEEPEPSPTPTEPVACDANAVEVVAVTDKKEYGSKAEPELSMKLTNTGDVDCILNVGTTQQVFTISSGDDVWWRSTDCQKEPSDMEVTLKAGQEVESADPIVWDRTRSDVDTCGDEDRPVAPGGGASYHLRVTIGDVESEHTRQFILG